MLPSRRARIENISRREAEGEYLWSAEFDTRCLRRLDALWGGLYYDNNVPQRIAFDLRVDGGWATPDSISPGHFGHHAQSGNEYIADLLSLVGKYVHGFKEKANIILREHRVAFIFVGDALLPRSSDELDHEVVHPALQLLMDRRFEGAHRAYQKALEEIVRGDAPDAITDAGTALEETLLVLGCDGNSLGAKVKDAFKRGLLAPADHQVSNGIKNFMDWASSSRNNRGDAHPGGDATVDDAWLMVHIVGALVVRLSRNSAAEQASLP